jgi:O-antigen/teichoic acid export membrane protein
MTETNIGERRIFINAASTMLQVVLNAVILFLLYRFLFRILGVAQIGIWSVVFASTALAGVAREGFAAAVIKYTARYLALKQPHKVHDLIQTSTLFIASLMGIIVIVMYPLSRWLLGLVIPEQGLQEAYSILPYALLSLWLMAVGDVFKAGLDGFQLILRRNIALIISAVCFLLFSYMLVPEYGLAGFAYAHVAQSGLTASTTWLFLKIQLGGKLPLIPLRWNSAIFREMLGYTLNFQAISISQTLFEPVTRFLLSKYGGLSMTGFYEMASKMVFVLRWSVVSTVQVMVPVIAHLKERDPGAVKTVYSKVYNTISYISLPMFSLIAISTPLISRAWIGYADPVFIIFSFILILSCLLHMLSTPAFIVNAGTGQLRGNTSGYIVMAGGNLILAWIGGLLLGGIGVVIGGAIAAVAGGLVTYLWYHLSNNLSFRQFLPKENLHLLHIGVLALVTFFLFYTVFPLWMSNMALYVLGFVVPVFVVTIGYMWVHPTRAMISRLALRTLF